MRTRMRTIVALLLVLSLAAPSVAQRARGDVLGETNPPGGGGVRDLGVEALREELVRMVHELEAVLADAAGHPVVGPDVQQVLVAGGLVPFPKSIVESLEKASPQELEQARELYATYPILLEVPQLLREALVELDAAPQERGRADLCETNYDAFEGFKNKRTAIRWLTLSTNVLSVTFRLTKMGKNLVGAITEDTPYVGRIPALALIALAGLQDTAIQVINLISHGIGTAKDVNELSIAACCVDPTPSQQLFGRGCDNRDNNCAGGTDEPAEDRWAPTLHVDTGVFDRCYPDGNEARDALATAVRAVDDCSEVDASIQLDVAPGICTGFATLQARDDAGNLTFRGPFELTVDPQAPVLAVPPLAACYETLVDARNDLERTVVTDCTAVSVDVDTVPAECAAQLSLTAVDSCGNRAEFVDDVVVDGAAPEVDVRKLLLPSVDGLFCFESSAGAVAAVDNALSVSDNCTPRSALQVTTQLSGPSCAATVTSSAIDTCGRVGVETLPVRIDGGAPVVRCEVATPTLWPADGTMVDVGFTMDAQDDCDPYGEIELEVTVTSDEPTALARQTLGGDDPYPDAELIRGPDGNVSRILLRAERSDYGPADGRVYRIRVVATDRCGQSAQRDCFVDVPRNLNKGQAVNTGQDYRADRQN